MKPSPVLRLHHRTIPATTWDGEPEPFTDAWLEQPIDDQWTACFRLAIQDDQPVISELRMFPSEDRWKDYSDADYTAGEWSIEQLGSEASVPPGGIGSQLVRRIPFGALDALPDIVGWVMTNHPQYDDTLTDVGLTIGVAGKRPGPKGPSEYELALLARRYVEEVSNGNTRPIAKLAKDSRFSAHAIRDQISRARDRGLLTKPSRAGKAGGRLTRRAITLIEHSEAEVAE